MAILKTESSYDRLILNLNNYFKSKFKIFKANKCENEISNEFLQKFPNEISYKLIQERANIVTITQSIPPTKSTVQSFRCCILIIVFILIFLLLISFELSSKYFFKSNSINKVSSSALIVTLCKALSFAKTYRLFSFENSFHNSICNDQVLSYEERFPNLPTKEYSNYASSKCSHFTCFDVYKCGIVNYNPYEFSEYSKKDAKEQIKVYVYPLSKNSYFSKNQEKNFPMSLQFNRILKAVIKSTFFTTNPEEACLFITNLDLLNLNSVDHDQTNRALWSLPHFSKWNGSNHLIFSMIFSSENQSSRIPLHLERALLAGGGFDLSNYRSNYDISIPVYSMFSQIYETEDFRLLSYPVDEISRLDRKWTLISTQSDSLTFEAQYYLSRLESIYSNKMILLGSNCSENLRIQTIKYSFPLNETSTDASMLYNETYVCNENRKIKYRYLDVLHNSEFCLILRTKHLGIPMISDALMSGCIPVIMLDSYVLPFSEKIDWASISIRVWQHSTNELFDIINSLTLKRRKQLRINGLYIWNKYFRLIEDITLTTLEIINDRVFSQPKNVFITSENYYQELTPLSFEYFSKGYSFLSPKSIYSDSQGFTAVILTYNRIESLLKVIMSISHVPSCLKIIVVWNNPDMKPPSPSSWPSISIPIQIIISEKNKLSNRFYPYASIETEAIFAIDDDIVMLTSDEIEFAFQTWREFPDRIVGFPSRHHYWDNFSQAWIYDSEWKNQVSLVLTGAAFYHYVILVYYTLISFIDLI